MMFEVDMVKHGPDYTGNVKLIQVDDYGVVTGVEIELTLEQSRELFGRLGQAIKTIEANADPS